MRRRSRGKTVVRFSEIRGRLYVSRTFKLDRQAQERTQEKKEAAMMGPDGGKYLVFWRAAAN
jgi:hypothetical protein